MSGDSLHQATAAEAVDLQPSILVVDDEELIRITVSDHLQECGYAVHTASTGDEALNILEAGKIPIALVLTDIVMPGYVDGFQLAQWARQYRPELPIILTSGYTRKAEVARELCPGVPFISKPYRLGDMANRIRELVGARLTK